MTQPDPTAAIEVFARLLCAADVHVHGDDHPTWQQLVGEPGQRIRDDYRTAASWLLPRMTVATKPPAVQSPADRAVVRAEALREAIDIAREEGHRLEEVAGIEPARGARCVAYLLRKLLVKVQPELRRLAGEQPAQDEAPECSRRETVEYFLQCRQPDDTWEDASSFMDDADWARERLAAKRERHPEFEFRIAQRTTTVVITPQPPTT